MDSGILIGARYRLDRRLAAGGMGAVWVAHDELLGRPVALKILHQSLAGDEGFRRRFRAEARAAARISHPGVVAVYDYGEDSDLTYLAMELVQGESLHELLRRRAPLGAQEAMGIVAQAAEALGEAHAHGLVHRDVKPANLLVGPAGAVKVTDFGIARAADTTTATMDGSVLGTVAYMSPEQVRGERVTAASDVYSLGVAAYECLAARRPFPSEESIAVALSHLHDPVPSLPAAVPAPVAGLVASMLQKDPAARPTAWGVAEQARQLAIDPLSDGRRTMPMTTPVVAPDAATSAGATQLVALSANGASRRPAPATAATLPASANGVTRPAPFRTLGAALGAAGIAANSRNARRRTSAGVVSTVVLAALAVGLLLASALPGTGPTGKASAASHRSGNHTAAIQHESSSDSTTTSSSTTTSTTPVLATTATTAGGHGPPGGPGPGGTGPGGPGHGHGGPGQGGPGQGGPGQGGPGQGGPGPGGTGPGGTGPG